MFIELTAYDEEKVLINTKHIEMVAGEDKYAIIFFRNKDRQILNVKESYQEVKDRIRLAKQLATRESY